MTDLTVLQKEAEEAARALCDAAHLESGMLVVVGCSSSEICGERIGTDSSPEVAKAVFAGLYHVFSSRGIYLAAQCCEHLNRALITEREAVPGAPIVNVVPQPKAGGSFATTMYHRAKCPVAVEEIKADAGMDSGKPARQACENENHNPDSIPHGTCLLSPRRW